MRFRNNRPLMIVVAIALLLVVLMVFFPGTGNMGGPEGLIGDAVSGTAGFFYSVGDFFSGIFSSVFFPDGLEEENARLKEQLAVSGLQLNEMSELEAENKRLKELWGYREDNPGQDLVLGRVILKDQGYYFDSFTINIGRNDGVSAGDPVITADGLVGEVVSAYGNSAKVRGIIDSQMKVGGIVERTRDYGTVQGGLQLAEESGLCQIHFLPPESELTPGDRVLTSGLSPKYPAGLVIGIIKEVGRGAGRTVILQPAVDFMHLELVMVIRMGETQTADQEGTP